jgi:uncharacterized protein (DUF488 family)
VSELVNRTVWTIGHSTRPLDELLGLLAEHAIEAVADVRRFPASRKHPQYNAAAFAAALAGMHIEYAPFESLGGRRRTRPGSPNTAWRNASFRGYADYMQTPPFQAALAELICLLEKKRTAILCAEAVWWRCHRALISDELKARGLEVCHIVQPGRGCEAHPYTSAAAIVDGKLSYADRQSDAFG